MPDVTQTNVLVIGASIAGLACAAALRRRNIEYTIIERHEQVATPWRDHYERLHLHTSKCFSSLPFKKFKRAIPRYPSRLQVIDYLEDYQKSFGIHPLFGTVATSVRREDGQWVTVTNSGSIRSPYLVLATGVYGKPRQITFPGVETFVGRILHSQHYRRGKDYRGEKVLVVGFGNSACEIAMDLYEQSAQVSMSVRSPVNVIPRDIFGVPILTLSLMLRRLPPRVADFVSAPLVRLLVGDITKLGLKKKSYGPLEEIRKDGTVPLLDIGTIHHIREGNISVFSEIQRIKGSEVQFKDGKAAQFDTIVAAIGYDRSVLDLVHVAQPIINDLSLPISKQKFFGRDGLYFCGHWISPTGQIREIGLDAKLIAKDIDTVDHRDAK